MDPMGFLNGHAVNRMFNFVGSAMQHHLKIRWMNCSLRFKGQLTTDNPHRLMEVTLAVERAVINYL